MIVINASDDKMQKEYDFSRQACFIIGLLFGFAFDDCHLSICQTQPKCCLDFRKCLKRKRKYLLLSGDGSLCVVVEQLSRILRTTNPEIATILPTVISFQTNPELLFQISSEQNFLLVSPDKTP